MRKCKGVAHAVHDWHASHTNQLINYNYYLLFVWKNQFVSSSQYWMMVGQGASARARMRMNAYAISEREYARKKCAFCLFCSPDDFFFIILFYCMRRQEHHADKWEMKTKRKGEKRSERERERDRVFETHAQNETTDLIYNRTKINTK